MHKSSYLSNVSHSHAHQRSMLLSHSHARQQSIFLSHSHAHSSPCYTLTRTHTAVHVTLSLARTPQSMLYSLTRTHTAVHVILSHSHARHSPCHSQSHARQQSMLLSHSHPSYSPCSSLIRTQATAHVPLSLARTPTVHVPLSLAHTPTVHVSLPLAPKQNSMLPFTGTSSRSQNDTQPIYNLERTAMQAIVLCNVMIIQA